MPNPIYVAAHAPRDIPTDLAHEITKLLLAADRDWLDVHAYCVHLLGEALTPAAAPASDKLDVDAEWVKAIAEAILKSNVKLSPNAQTFVAHTFARASQYKSVRFSPKQWSWFSSIMADAGVEAIDLPVEVK